MYQNAKVLVLLSSFLLLSCDKAPRYAVLTVEDSQGLATEATALGIGSDLNEMTRVEMADKSFPLTLSVSSDHDGELDYWVEAWDKDKQVLARGYKKLLFAQGRSTTATIHLVNACGASSDCDNNDACDGIESCVHFGCQPGEIPEIEDNNECTIDACDAMHGVTHDLVEDGNACSLVDDSGICLSGTCVKSHCGDAFTDRNAAEQCDDGNLVDDDGCDSNCKLTACGNGIVGENEVCDDGNLVDNDGCDSNCTVTACGNGVIAGDETCDDGNEVNGDGCDNNCTATACGNGVVAEAETCDDGNLVDNDGCDSNCTVTACGNGVLAGTELCDDGNALDDDGCDTNCTPTGCGNGLRAGAEICDDGNLVDNDGCDSNCTVTACGNGVKAGSELCDDGNLVDNDGCDSNCTPTACGNNVRAGAEVCDDGNATNGDGCDSNCTVTACGNGVVAGSEACDDGNQDNNDGCDNNCTVSACGNGIVAGNEACDDGNQTSNDGCDSNCTVTACGNGVVAGDEACDDGNQDNNDGCDNNCTVTACGNGVVAGSEACDDGNQDNNDGCDNNCTVTACGNGIKTAGEACDDGDVVNGDGCDNNCTTTACGNGIQTAGEACDDGDLQDGDGCDSNCKPTGCGNGVQTAGEECDDGNASNTDDCVEGCNLPSCGDGFVWQGHEGCDDGNQTLTDSCPDGPGGTCQTSTCGDGFINEGSELCDDGNDIDDNNGCSASCQRDNECGNGLIEDLYEVCDDNNLTSGDGCDENCTVTACGNGIVTAGEDCDDNNLVDGDGCDSNCKPTGCGNGIVTAGEDCDDSGESETCNVDCSMSICGDAQINTTAGEVCDEGSGVNSDVWSFAVHCNADCSGPASYCGDGFTDTGFEDCDDAGESASCNDNCTSSYCGDGVTNISAGETCDDAGDSTRCTSLCEVRSSIMGSGFTMCALGGQGQLKCWGYNFRGQLGQGHTMSVGWAAKQMGDYLPPIDLGQDKTAKSVAVGGYHVCAIMQDDSLKCWGAEFVLGLEISGDNLGDEPGEMGDQLATVDLGSGLHPVFIAAGSAHTCAILNDGAVKCWGDNYYGQLGYGDKNPRGNAANSMGDNLPTVELGTNRSALALSLYGSTSCALLDNFKLKCWGDNSYGQLGIGDVENRGDDPGEMGDNLPVVDLGQDASVISVSVGQQHVCAILDSGDAKCWGASLYGHSPGTMGDGLPRIKFAPGESALSLSAGRNHTCAIVSGGTVKCWGSAEREALGILNPSLGFPTQTEYELLGVDLGQGAVAVKLAAGSHSTCALLSSGSVKCWGYNSDGQLGQGDARDRGFDSSLMGDNLPPVELGRCGDGALGPSETCDDGFTDACGSCNADCSAPGTGSSCGDTEICPEFEACDDGAETVQCNSDCSLAVCGDSLINATAGESCDDGFTDACGSCNADCTAPGTGSSCGDGDFCPETESCDYGINSLYCTTGCATRPQVFAGLSKTCWNNAAGEVFCWGSNSYGQLGQGDGENRGDEPSELGDKLSHIDLGRGAKAVSMALGYLHNCALLASGRVKCWGRNYSTQCQLGIGGSYNRGVRQEEMGDNLPFADLGNANLALQIAAGRDHTCIITDLGDVKCWGYGLRYQLGNGSQQSICSFNGDMGDNLPTVDLGSGLVPIKIDSAENFTCVLFDNEKIKCWGNNSFGQLGLGHTQSVPVKSNQMGDNLAFVDLGTAANVLDISVAADHACAVLTDGRLKCWGFSIYGCLGYEDSDNRGDEPGEMGDNLPAIDLGTGQTAVSVSAGGGHTCALLSGGAVKCWGNNKYGQLGQGDTNNRGDEPGEMGDNLPAIVLPNP